MVKKKKKLTDKIMENGVSDRLFQLLIKKKIEASLSLN